MSKSNFVLGIIEKKGGKIMYETLYSIDKATAIEIARARLHKKSDPPYAVILRFAESDKACWIDMNK